MNRLKSHYHYECVSECSNTDKINEIDKIIYNVGKDIY